MPTEDDYEKIVRITLRAARVCSGYSTEEAAICVNISPETLCEYERDAGKMPLNTANKLLRLYRFPSYIIHFGNESEFIKIRNNVVNK
jgi:DNA-binding XRE family transcriptional regulator